MEQTAIHPPGTSPSAARLLTDLRQPVLIGLSKTLRRAFASTIDDLLERLLKETGWQERQSIEDALDLLRHGRDGIESKFDRACADSWDERIGPGGRSSGDGRQGGGAGAAAAGGKPAAGALATLSLVEDSAIGDQLLVGRISARSRRRMDEEQVDGLRARFGALLGRDWFADNEYPVAPDIVFEALRKALAEFGQARVVLFLLEAFEPRISADLSALYADLNQRLVRAGVMPEIRYQIQKPPTSSPYGNGRSQPATDDDVPARAAPETGGASLSHPRDGPARAAASRSDSFVARMQAAVSADGAGQAFGYPAEVAGGPAGGGAAAGSGTGMAAMPAEAVSELVSQLDQRIHAAQGSATRYLSDPARFASADAPQAPASDRLLAALTTLQVTSPAAEQDAAALVSAAKAVSKAAAREHGSPLERLIIETVSLVFEHVYEDEDIADAIKQQLLRLQVAAFKAALIDPSFFARPDHPMRRLIDRIAGIGSDPDFDSAAGSPLVTDVAEVVTWVLASFERDLVTFETALERIDGIAEAEAGRRAGRLAKIAAAAQKAEALERARGKVRDELSSACGDDTPEFICRFIADPWTEVVSRIATGAEFAPFDTARARRTMDVLLWSIASKSAADIPVLAAELPQLIADLSRGLSFIALSGAERELFFSELLAWHGATIEDAKRAVRNASAASAAAAPVAVPKVPPVAAGPAAPVAPVAPTVRPVAPAGEGAGAPSSEARDGSDIHAGVDRDERVEIDDAVQQLGLTNGTEVELDAPNGDRRRFKVGWMSPSRNVYIFSRYPRDHWTARRAMLNSLLAQGRMRVVEKASETGRAIESLKAR